MKLKNILLAATVCFAFSACESQLEIKPISTISNSNYWKSSSDVQGYLNGLYNNYRSLTSTTLYGEDRGDAMQEGFIGGVTRSLVHMLNEEYGLNWLSFYTNLHHCNMIIKYAPGIAFSDKKEQNRIIAQAYALRARDYLTLLQMWGEVPLVLEPTESFDKGNKPARKSKDEVMAQIISDINTAISLFPEKSIPNKNKVSYPAAQMIKAEALAWNYTVLHSNNSQDLTDAIAALTEVEQSGVSMMENYAEVFDVSHRKNSEIIFSLYVLKDEFNNMYMSTLSMAATAGLIGGCANADEIPYSNSTVARHVYAPSDALKSLFETKDTRRGAVWVDGVDANGKVLFTSQNKFRGTKYELDRYYDNDIVIYRLADAHLLKAELLCYLGGANVNSAIDEMRPTRTRAGLGAYTGSSDQKTVQKEILNERGRELCFELKRWPDLMRAHAAGTIDLYDYVPNLKGKSCPLYFPILKSMMDQNENLEQTEGY